MASAPGGLGVFSFGQKLGKVMPKQDILDPYVKVTYGEESKSTEQLLNGGLNCEFPEQHLLFAQAGKLAPGTKFEMKFQVLDKDNFDSDDLVGSGVLEPSEEELGELASGKVCPHVVELHDKQNYFAGMVFMDIKHDVASGQLDVRVTRCKNLRDVRESTARDSTDAGANQLLYMAIFSLVFYFVCGVLFYSLVPGALFANGDAAYTDKAGCIAACENSTLAGWAGCDANCTNVTAIELAHGGPAFSDCGAVATYSGEPGGIGSGDDSCIAIASKIDALYFTVVTLTTVGYGDMGPQTQSTKLFTCFFALIGIGFIGVCLGIVAGRILDQQERMMKILAEEARQAAAELAEELDDLVDGDDESEEEEEPPTKMADETKTAIVNTCMLVAVIAIGTIFYMVENSEANFADCLYFATITATTVGYGDESPSTPTGRLFACIYLLSAVLVTARALGALADLPLAVRRRKHKEAVLAQFGADLTMHELDMICRNFGGSDGRCTRLEFVIAMLIKTSTIGQDDIDMAAKQFDLLDKDKSGSLGIQDLLLQETLGDGDDGDEKAQEHMKKKNLKLIQQEEEAIQRHIVQLTEELEVLRSKKKMFTEEPVPDAKA